jgi:hypothetical protein
MSPPQGNYLQTICEAQSEPPLQAIDYLDSAEGTDHAQSAGCKNDRHGQLNE